MKRRTLRDYLAICRWAEERALSLARIQVLERAIESGADACDSPDVVRSASSAAVSAPPRRARPKP
jgi:hypothetical protein